MYEQSHLHPATAIDAGVAVGPQSRASAEPSSRAAKGFIRGMSARHGLLGAAGCALSLAVAAQPVPAAAFTFAEHVRITQRAVSLVRDQHRDPDLPPFGALARLWSALRPRTSTDHPELCASLDATSAVVRSLPVACVAFSDLPALAADHSCSPGDLERVLAAAGRAAETEPADDRTDAHWVFRVLRDGQVADQMVQDQGGVPGGIDARGADARTRIRADLNVQLTLHDPDYVSRASDNLTHFLPERLGNVAFARWLTDAVCASVADGVCAGGPSSGASTSRGANAVSSYVIYHLAALRLARDFSVRCTKGHSCANSAETAWRVLRAEAFALHFLEDAFASGHGVGVPLNGERRSGMHDYHNSSGVRAEPWDGGPAYFAHGDGFLQPVDEERAAAAVARSLTDLADVLEAPLAGAEPRITALDQGDIADAEVRQALDYNSCLADPDPALRAVARARLLEPGDLCDRARVSSFACEPLGLVPRPALRAARERSRLVSARGLGLGLGVNVSPYLEPATGQWGVQGLLAAGFAFDADSVLSPYRDSLTLLQVVGGVEYRATPGVTGLFGMRVRLPFTWGVPIIGWLAWGLPIAVSTTNAPPWAWQRSAAATRFPRPLQGNPFPGRHLLQLTLGREVTLLWRFRSLSNGGDVYADGFEVQVPVVSMTFRRSTVFDRTPFDIVVFDLSARLASVPSQGGFEGGAVLSIGTRLRYLPSGSDPDARP